MYIMSLHGSPASTMSMQPPPSLPPSFPSDPYPEGFRASPDFRLDMFSTYHGGGGLESHPRSSSPPPWFVREGDMVPHTLHQVSEQVTMTHAVLYICMHVSINVCYEGELWAGGSGKHRLAQWVCFARGCQPEQSQRYYASVVLCFIYRQTMSFFITIARQQ